MCGWEPVVVFPPVQGWWTQGRKPGRAYRSAMYVPLFSQGPHVLSKMQKGPTIPNQTKGDVNVNKNRKLTENFKTNVADSGFSFW